MAQNSVELAGLFQAVTQALSENQQDLDRADEYNRDHGSNMVQTFQTITAALEKKKGGSDYAALNYAAKQLAKKSTSGSGKLYAEHLSQAAGQFKGKKVDAMGALQLLQTLIGAAQGGQPAAQQPGGMEDLLGGLLGGGAAPAQQSGGMEDLIGSLLGGGATPAQSSQSGGMEDLIGSLLGGGSAAQPSQSGGGDLMGALVGSLLGGGSARPKPQSGGDLLTTLLTSLISGGGLQTLAQALLSGSDMGKASHREQSTQVVVDAFLQALGSGGR